MKAKKLNGQMFRSGSALALELAMSTDMSQSEIAKRCKITPQTVKQAINQEMERQSRQYLGVNG